MTPAKEESCSLGPAKVGAIVLAAGASRRLGTPKQILEFEGLPLLLRSVMAAQQAGLDPVVVVTGAHADQVQQALESRDELETVRWAFNAEWERGMGSSIACGMRALAKEELEAVIVMVCDQPMLSGELLVSIRDRFDRNPHRVVESDYGGSSGPPVLFGRSHFESLRSLDGENGARSVVKGAIEHRQAIDFAGGDRDVDTAADCASFAIPVRGPTER